MRSSRWRASRRRGDGSPALGGSRRRSPSLALLGARDDRRLAGEAVQAAHDVRPGLAARRRALEALRAAAEEPEEAAAAHVGGVHRVGRAGAAAAAAVRGGSDRAPFAAARFPLRSRRRRRSQRRRRSRSRRSRRPSRSRPRRSKLPIRWIPLPDASVPGDSPSSSAVASTPESSFRFTVMYSMSGKLHATAAGMTTAKFAHQNARTARVRPSRSLVCCLIRISPPTKHPQESRPARLRPAATASSPAARCPRPGPRRRRRRRP